MDYQESSPGPQFESISSSVLSLLYGLSVCDYRKNHSFDYHFVAKVMFLLYNMLSRFVMAFLPRSKHLNFMAAGTVCSDFGAPKRENLSLSPFSPLLFAMK